MFGSENSRLPRLLKLFYFAYLAVLVPTYLHIYGAANFLWLCDVALFLGAFTVFTEKPLAASMAATGIVLGQGIWTLDWIATMFGHPIFNMTNYMFDSSIPLGVRALSLYHVWLPFVLLYVVWKLGYDRRALKYWMITFVSVLLFSFLFIPAGPPPADNPGQLTNIDFVYGLGDTPQTYMHPLAWLALLMVTGPTLLYVPSHLLFKRIFREPEAG